MRCVREVDKKFVVIIIVVVDMYVCGLVWFEIGSNSNRNSKKSVRVQKQKSIIVISKKNQLIFIDIQRETERVSESTEKLNLMAIN